ncbi:MAG: O-antigen ligase family protein [Bdellovibrionota bacterium]|nr:MAG: O-antigen ligase family protein [Bdellovibrionota bacterium]
MQRIVFFASHLVLLWALLALPFFFGAVHPMSYLSFSCAVGVTTLLVAWTFRRTDQDQARGYFSHFTGIVLAMLLAWLATILVQIFVYQLFKEPHPVLGAVSPWVNLSGASDGIILVMAFLGLFAITRLLLAQHPAGVAFIENVVIAAGGIVTFVALGHWFYDSGSLFGVFAPDNIFVSHRARWPFVNANSLGHFLLIPLFLTVYRLREQAVSWREGIRLPERLGRREVKQILLHRSSRKIVPQMSVLAVLLIAMLIAIAGTLSRGSWLGLAVGGAVLYLLHLRVHVPSLAVPELPPARRRRGRPLVALTERLSEGIPWFFSRLVPPLIICLALLFFLAGRGLDLVESRIEYSLLASKDDLRWILYRDSWRMFGDTPFFGVGFNNWLELYSRYASPALAGLNPEFLHSDPLQLIVEMGIVGALPLLVLFVVLGRALLGLRGQDQGSRRARFLLCALLAVVTASLLDFPFRIPAITMQFSVILALTTFYLDQLSSSAVRSKLSIPGNTDDNSGVESDTAVILSS